MLFFLLIKRNYTPFEVFHKKERYTHHIRYTQKMCTRNLKHNKTRMAKTPQTELTVNKNCTKQYPILQNNRTASAVPVLSTISVTLWKCLPVHRGKEFQKGTEMTDTTGTELTVNENCIIEYQM